MIAITSTGNELCQRYTLRMRAFIRDTKGVPTILMVGPYRMYLYSHEPNEPPHIHVDRDDQSAKFWLNPVALAVNLGFNPAELRRIQRLVTENRPQLLEEWHERFPA